MLMIEYVNTRDMYTLMRMEANHRKPFRSMSKMVQKISRVHTEIHGKMHLKC